MNADIHIDEALQTLREGSSNGEAETDMSSDTSNSGNFLYNAVESKGDVYDNSDRPYLGFFEGPEKTLEVCYRPGVGGDAYDSTTSEPIGMRRLAREDLDEVCSKARCTIMSKVSNQYLDAYVLSESSLFVYPHMVVLKTCGTTTLLRCIAKLIELGKKVGLEVSWVGYSRKNFNFPFDQQYPHESFHQEIEYINSHRHLAENLNGNAYTLGPVTDDHWFVYVADKTIRSVSLDTDTDRVLNVMMFDIDEKVAEKFYYEQYKKELLGEMTEEELNGEEAALKISGMMTKAAGIDALVPGSVIDPRAFEPCGYSMNAILFKSYSTMHITPEAGSSYASFETNQKFTSYTALINNVVNTFKPKRFVLTLMADEGGLRQINDIPLFAHTPSSVFVPVVNGNKGETMDYKRQNLASIQVEDDCCCMMGNFVHDGNSGFTEEELQTIAEKRRASKLRGMSVGGVM
mmetsp:Transcript_2836/g.4455  ORF Transcript_2836/g.4455 Transcript_2836/m.4455 type:complete len:460 (+) Transcript_2836:306-1685(+)|eukprot:CAMPEP_0196811488 /NCGR_PEP_ID=MMETSP1362-20130617/17954_1 /TAXON_ID=163516 /ORGANISM="Leptocylindrus danicus, Strain CCMP1856" /LENGTH=459 /DNA_ID=CAMNT_0042186795 /DNA_START=306 /DNA_END=1685 /DNA_ORIENTATION=+